MYICATFISRKMLQTCEYIGLPCCCLLCSALRESSVVLMSLTCSFLFNSLICLDCWIFLVLEYSKKKKKNEKKKRGERVGGEIPFFIELILLSHSLLLFFFLFLVFLLFFLLPLFLF